VFWLERLSSFHTDATSKGLAAQQFGGAIFMSHFWVVIFSVQVSWRRAAF